MQLGFQSNLIDSTLIKVDQQSWSFMFNSELQFVFKYLRVMVRRTFVIKAGFLVMLEGTNSSIRLIAAAVGAKNGYMSRFP